MHFDPQSWFLTQKMSFLQRPIKDFRFPMPSLTNWFTQDQVDYKREAIANLIQSLMDKHRPDHQIKLPVIVFNSSITQSDERNIVTNSVKQVTDCNDKLACSSSHECKEGENAVDEKSSVSSLKLKTLKDQKELILEEAPVKQIVIVPQMKRIKVNLKDKNRPHFSASPKRPGSPLPNSHQSGQQPDNEFQFSPFSKKTCLDETNAQLDNLFKLEPSSHLRKAICSNSISVNPICTIDDSPKSSPENKKTPIPCKIEEDDVIFETAYYKPTFRNNPSSTSLKKQTLQESDIFLLDAEKPGSSKTKF